MKMRTRTWETTKTTSTIRNAAGVLAFGLGSNLGDCQRTLRRAARWLEELCGPLRVAPFYSSHPISPVPQPDYLNTVAIAPLPADERGDLATAQALLEQLKNLEQRADRRPGIRFGPRSLDIDLLLFGALVHRDPEPPDSAAQALRWLILPHPRMRQRRFVLAPLNDLAPNLELPPDGAPVHRLLSDLGDEQAVTRLG